MASDRGIRAGRAFVELFADDTKLVRGLRLAERKLRAFGQKVSRLGGSMMKLSAVVVGPLLAASKAFSSMGDEVAKMSKRTGVSVESLSQLRFVASQTGTEFGAMENALRKMQRSIYDAGRGLSTQTDALSDLGLAFKDLDGLSPEDQFKLLADRIGGVSDPTKKAAIAMSLFGRAGTAMLPMFAQGAAGIEALMVEADRLGLTISGKDAKAAEVFTDVLDTLWKSVKMGVFHIGAALAPAIQQAAQAMTEIVAKASAWIQQNQQILVTVLKVGAAVGAAGAALMALGLVMQGVAMTIGVVTKALVILLSPVGMVIGAVVALGTVLVSVFGRGQTLGEKFAHVMVWMRDAVVTALSAVTFVFKRFGTAMDAVMLRGLYQATKFYNTFEHGFKHFVTFLEWEVDSVVRILRMLSKSVDMVCLNISKNLAALWEAIKGFASGKGWHFEWTGLTEGLEVAFKKMPVIAKRELGVFEKGAKAALEQIDNDIGRDFAAHDAEFRKEFKDSPLGKLLFPEAATEGGAAAAPVAPKMPNLDFSGMDGSVKAAVKRTIEVQGSFSAAAFGRMGVGSSVADRTAAASEETAKNTKRIAQQTDDMAGLAFG